MKYMLDTNICVYLINSKSQKIINRFKKEDVGNICISSITYYELYHGIINSRYFKDNLTILEKFLAPIEIYEYDINAAKYSAQIRLDLKKSGTPIGQMDLLIAGHSLSANCILVTNNTKEFKRVKKLKVENWV